jgi:PKD repeat protein
VALAASAPAAAAEDPIGDGAWSWFGDPRAVTHDGRTYVGWVDHEGDIKLSSYDHATGDRVTATIQARLNEDDHANPSIHVRPDGRLMVFYSRHVGPAMHYRVSSQPGDVTSWEAPQTIPTNSPGGFGYTYPNPIRLEDESATYLFWRGGNYNPTFSIQQDGSSSWTPARTIISFAGQRPYVKYDSSGGDTIHMAYTNAHPGEFESVNIYYARVRAGKVERVGGQQIGSLDDPIAPDEGDLVYDVAAPTWVHDVAVDSSGSPVIVFASFPSPSDHRYHYAHWTGSAWDVHEITPAGGSIRGDGKSPYYSGGLTLDHEDPFRVYLSRQVGSSWQVEAWTTTAAAHGTSWTSQPLSTGSTEKNVRPVSPRGMTATGGEMSAIWMRGAYPDYWNYETAIQAFTPLAANAAPIADAEPAVRAGRAPLEVRFDASFSRDPDGSIVSYEWDFGDGSSGTGIEPTHAYASGGRYFPTLTVTDDDGESSVFVDEIVVDLPAAPTVHSGGASGSTVHGAISPENQATDWSVEYGPSAEYGAVTAAETLPGDSDLHQVSAELPGLVAGRLYHYRLVASNGSGSTSGEDRVLVAGGPPASDAYREMVLGDDPAAYWRLGELSGSTASDETGANPGAFSGRHVLGQPGVLGPLGNTSAGFDGLHTEVTASAPGLSGDATLEGWFRWEAGTTVLRDHTSGSPNGWMPAFANGTGQLAYRLGGQNFNTGQPVGTVRDGEWHHLVATHSGTTGRLYLDGELLHSGTGSGGDPSTGPWHVMQNGQHEVYSEGQADEIALYPRALSATEIGEHYGLASQLAATPLPPEFDPGPGDADPGELEPPLAGTDASGGVLGPDPFPAAESAGPAGGTAAVIGARLIVRGAPGVRNNLIVRKRGDRWIARDKLAALRAGPRCRRLSARAVSCRAAGVKRIVVYGGAGDDRLTVIGRLPARLIGGPGRDIVTQRPR